MQRGNVHRRLDAAFHSTPDMAAVIKKRYENVQTVAEFCEFIDSGRPVSHRVDDTGIPAYEVGHILTNELKDTEVLVSSDADKTLQRHDILTGRVGSLGVFAEYQFDTPASFSDNVLRLRPKEGNGARSAFVAEYLNSVAGNTQVLRDSRGSLQRVVTQKSLGDVILPHLGELETEIMDRMDAARAERKAKLAEADALLAGVDDFVLDALGIAPPPADNRRVFGARLASSRPPGQINADYHHPERILALRAMNDAAGASQSAALVEVVDFIRNQLKSPGENYLSLAHVQSHTGELTDSTDTAAGNCYTYQVDDVLFARLRPYLNKVYRAEMDGCCSTEFHVLRVKHRDSLLPEYLAAILRSRPVLAQTIHMMAGNTHPRLTDRDVANLRIPIPVMEAQETIATEVIRRRETARRLRSEAEAGWQEAKQWFEGQLLGDGDS